MNIYLIHTVKYKMKLFIAIRKTEKVARYKTNKKAHFLVSTPSLSKNLQ